MCQALGISRQSYYYEPRSQKDEAALEEQVVNSFSQSRKNYGSRKLKHELINFGLMISRRKIRKIMKKHGLHSTYTKLKYQDLIKSKLQKNHLNQYFHFEYMYLKWKVLISKIVKPVS